MEFVKCREGSMVFEMHNSSRSIGESEMITLNKWVCMDEKLSQL